MSEPRTPILQFGTSRFLQAHADLFFAQAEPPLAVTVVQSSGDAARAARLAALAAPGGYPVRIRGLERGRAVEQELRVDSVRRTLSTASDWPALERLFCEQVEIVISNTADAGYQPQPADLDPAPSQAMSFPAKLAHLLAARFHAGARPLQVMPLELVPENGRVLRARVLEILRGNGMPAAVADWVAGLGFANSLVDRIVSEPLEPAGAVAEPYALWAIEAAPGIIAPCNHPAVQMVPDLEEIERLKLHILNLGHTALVDFWRRSGARPGALVRELMDAPEGAALLALYDAEVIPGFAQKGREPQARAYLAATLDRLRNPFLDHRIEDIAQNHTQKAERRIAAFLDWIGPGGPATPQLHAIVERARA
ncbi:MAG TPA: mannitol dehydrogenase family protein [Paracoccus solventivorans]|uniref:Mannitol dehydrogenase family protein n=1 Tax=Paracoccus solventivorans TaxID=53463 RepID=A0A832QWK8_9RHOB|nr:mannitol dehydrogenase family protein [Paracoccus solventivorans]HHW32715.1 mannitol dehydrogenase family protein [Paracoccus solventivorans]